MKLNCRPWINPIDGEISYHAIDKLVYTNNMELIKLGLETGIYEFASYILVCALNSGKLHIAELALDHPVNLNLLTSIAYEAAITSNNPAIKALYVRIKKQMDPISLRLNKERFLLLEARYR